MNKIYDTSWKLYNEIGRLWIYPWARLLFISNGIPWKKGWCIYGMPIIQKHRKSHIQVGYSLNLRSSIRSNPLSPNHPVILCTWQSGAVLEIGNNFGMTGGTLCAAERITIGNRVSVGANTTIIDTDFHPLDPEQRVINPQDAKTSPIVIENDAFIGMSCLILKGVRLGQGCVIGAGSVVTRDVPAKMVAAGNPAKVIGPVKKEIS